MVYFKLLIAITVFLNTSFHQVFVCGDEKLKELASLYCGFQPIHELSDGHRYYELTDELAIFYCKVILEETFDAEETTVKNKNGLKNFMTSFRYLTNKIIRKKYEVPNNEKMVPKERMKLKRNLTMGYYNNYRAHTNNIDNKLQFINLPRGFCEHLCLGEILDWFSTDNPDEVATQRPQQPSKPPGPQNQLLSTAPAPSLAPEESALSNPDPNANPSTASAPNDAPTTPVTSAPSSEPAASDLSLLPKVKELLPTQAGRYIKISRLPTKRANRPISKENPYGNFPKEKADCALACQAIFKVVKFEDITTITRYEIFKEFYHKWTYDTLNYEGVTGKKFPTEPTEKQIKIKHDIETYLLKYFKIYEDKLISLHKNASDHKDLNFKSLTDYCETTGKSYVEDFEEDVIKGKYCIFVDKR